MPSQEHLQSCSKKYRDAAELLCAIARLIGWIGVVGAIVVFAFSFLDVIDRGFGIVMSICIAASSGMTLLLGNLVKSQCDVINAILEILGDQKHNQN